MARTLRLLAKIVVVAVISVVVARLSFPLPSLEGRSVTSRLPASVETRLGAGIMPMMIEHSGRSGAMPLKNGVDAFVARILLANAAERSLDVQYYIWQKDLTGLLLIDALRRAAQRGVRVRLLLDDNGTPDLDPELAALNALDNMEVRLFNPFTLRNPRQAAYLFDFPRLNRRMHNKSFTVDGVVTIVGGRNVGDVYFAHGVDGHYFDLDVMAAGQAATDTAQDFDRYWSSASSYPVDLLIDTPAGGLATLTAAVAAARAAPDAQIYRQAIGNSRLLELLAAGTLPLDWVPMQLVSDDPAKGLGEVEEEQLMINQLASILGRVERRIDLISAYFVPNDGFTRFLASLAGNGVRVRVLTNSQEATDVLPVHSGYVNYRDDLLEAGVEVFELRSDQEQRFSDQFGILGSSTTSLHAKTLAVDNTRVFIGSFNFDPRSALLNTEMGFLIESATLATRMTNSFDRSVPVAAYQAIRTSDGATGWIERGADGSEIRHDVEPYTSGFSRFVVKVMSWLPIAWML